jgi:iron(III) transport system permease protein
VLAYYLFIHMPVAAVLKRLDPTLEDVAASLDAAMEGFFSVILPQLKLAICGGALLVALHLLAEYGLYVMIRFDTFTTAIYDQFQSTFSGPAANMLAGVLALCCLAILLLEGATRGKARYARIGRGARAKAADAERAGRIRRAARCFLPWCCSPRRAADGALPLAVAGRSGKLVPRRSRLSLPDADDRRRRRLLTTACAIPIAWLGVRYPNRVFRLLEGVNYITSSLPGIVTALALVTVTIHYARPVYQTEVTLFGSSADVYAQSADQSARRNCPGRAGKRCAQPGAKSRSGALSVTMRLAAPGAAAGAALVFLGVSNELTATLLLSPLGTRTLATGFGRSPARLRGCALRDVNDSDRCR